jgi:FlaA1/EpsC-like NDP-sugar epimerase
MNRVRSFIVLDPVVLLLISLISLFLVTGDTTNGVLYAFVFLGPIIAFSFQQRLWRYASIDDVWDFVKVISPFVVSIPVLWFLNLLEPTYLIIGGLSVTYLFVSRFGLRLFARPLADKEAPRVLIYGAGEAGSRVYKTIQHEKQVIGFFDDDTAKINFRLHAKLVYVKDIVQRCQSLQIDEVIIAIPTLSKRELQAKVSLLASANVAISVLPSFEEIDPKNYKVVPRAIKIEDVLGRKEVQLDLKGLASFVSKKRILITGAGGSIGSELACQLASYDIEELILLDSYENGLFSLGQELQSMKVNYRLRIVSIQDAHALQELFEATKPQLVYHAAAHKHVPLMEDSPNEAIKNNIQGSYHVFQSAMSVGVEHVVVISTDKAVNPTNIMGATKRLVERVMQTVASNSKTIFSAVRFGNVLGSNGSVIPLFEAQIAQGGPVLVTDPAIKRYFMTIPEAVQLVLESSLYAKGGDIFVLDMGEPIFIKDLAESMIRLAGFEPHQDIQIKYTGLRPGEKMFEELVFDSNVISKTANPKIFIETVTEEPLDLSQIHNQDYLRSLVQATIQRPVENANVSAS